MKISCIPWAMILGWPDNKPDMTLEGWIDIAVDDYHLDGIEVLNSYFRGRDAAYERTISDRLLAKGLAVSQYTSDAAFALVDGEARDEMIERVKGDIDKAVMFHTNMMRITGGDPKPDVSRGESLRRVIEGLAEVLPYAEKRGVVLAFENHVVVRACPEIGGIRAEFVEILETLKSPFLRANFDTSNAFKSGQDPVAFLEAIYPSVVHLHVSDIDNGRESVVGEGDVDLDAVFRFLKARGYRGWASVEYSARGRAGLDRSIANVRRAMGGGAVRTPIVGCSET